MNAKTTIDYLVKIPNDEGTAFIDQVAIKVPAEIDAQTGEVLLGGEAQRLIEETRARRMGLLTPAELKALRASLGLSQAEMAAFIQAGEKSYTRWELGYGRQSRLVNNFLRLLKSGNINLTHLRPRGFSVWNRLQHAVLPPTMANQVSFRTVYTGFVTVQAVYTHSPNPPVEKRIPNEAVAA